MDISAVSEVVSVTADDNVPQTSSDPSENLNANNITRDALDRVPVFDLDYITLLSRFLSDDAIATSGVSLVVNGVEANGPGVSASAVQEVKINQNPYSARFARPGRARVEITTKAGTPAYHGTVNFLTRNSVFDASNTFAPTKPSESRYMEEGSFTGPLGRDKRNTFLLSLEQDNDNLQAVVHAFGSPTAQPPTSSTKMCPRRSVISSALSAPSMISTMATSFGSDIPTKIRNQRIRASAGSFFPRPGTPPASPSTKSTSAIVTSSLPSG